MATNPVNAASWHDDARVTRALLLAVILLTLLLVQPGKSAAALVVRSGWRPVVVSVAPPPGGAVLRAAPIRSHGAVKFYCRTGEFAGPRPPVLPSACRVIRPTPGRYVWVPGHWVQQPYRLRYWVPGRWQRVR